MLQGRGHFLSLPVLNLNRQIFVAAMGNNKINFGILLPVKSYINSFRLGRNLPGHKVFSIQAHHVRIGGEILPGL